MDSNGMVRIPCGIGAAPARRLTKGLYRFLSLGGGVRKGVLLFIVIFIDYDLIPSFFLPAWWRFWQAPVRWCFSSLAGAGGVVAVAVVAVASSDGGSSSFSFTEISTIGTNVSGDLTYLEAGANATFSVNVSCSVSCDVVQVLFFRSVDSDISPQDTEIDNVTLNGTLGRTRIFPFTAPDAPGSYYYGVCIESICSAALKVFVPKAKVIGVDVIGVDVITTDGTLAAGTAANFAVDVSCLASCADVDVRYFRSADGDISPQDTEIGIMFL